MRITRTSPFSGEKHTLEIDISPEVCRRIQRGNRYHYDEFNHLSEGERRFLIDGITPEGWEEMFEDEAHYLYDRKATRAFWVCYAIVLVAAALFCYLLWS